jgi:hypothetical protein
MTTREKIIVGLMLLTVAYGAYILFLEPPSNAGPIKQTGQGLEELNDFISKVAAATQASLSEKDAYVLERAETQWPRDPMLTVTTELPVLEEKKAPEKSPATAYKVNYTGYLQMGGERLAIINGMEYEVGEKIEPGGFVVQKISPTLVVIESTEGRKTSFSIPLDETE